VKVGDLVSRIDIFGEEHMGVVTAGYMDLVDREGLKMYGHKNLVEVLFNRGRDVIFVEQLRVHSAVAQW